MEVQQVLHMNWGNGETSYATNSKLQELVINKAKPVVIGSISDLYTTNLPRCLRVADLGCSSGPNTLLVISEIIDAIDETCHQLKLTTPEFQVFLNDLPSNDFNTIFKTLPAFYDQLKKEKGDKFGPCSITGLPGSFYDRLFPTSTIDFLHSSYSLHWLSQVPPTVESSNKGNIYLASTSPPSVTKAYLEQFQKDFFLFLGLRSKEITRGGRMVITMLGRRSEEPFGKEAYFWELLSHSLNDLVLEGLIEEAKVDSFNLPFYMPSHKELEAVVCEEGSFYLDQLQIFDVNWDGSDDDDDNNKAGFMFDRFISGQKMAKCVRAVAEPMIACHFGETVIDILFNRYMEYVSDHLSKEEGKFVNFVISLKGK
ncbi:probable jasmonic acid carboxyl methyltransferase 2 isoform X1 [Telopea speciosissima]|uniref:probable jasmonic acid carboxyl methyltransferase 2 isoform X1 n=1 Tax=Telopea speciosissima TaxID=54955 RepID=UPI001CC559CD|nr:probable jasmonic acid carboxyl methyltransferase 2 isoform X1 [Telopea speciosissima]XP_043700549.1 probable jasmonic acid carboxyl methyltransferase 2 isoform X1 [Telopea speciosissima]